MNSCISFVGNNLVRPECVLTTRAGNVYTSDFRGGVTKIDKQGRQTFYGGQYNEYGLLQPNGIALLADGSFLIAHLGTDRGGIFKINRDNIISPLLTQIDGEELPPSNFVYLDHQGRIWVTVSTRHRPRANAYRSDIKDGFIVLIDNKDAKIVADGIGYTNELYIHPDGKDLYVNATFSRELIRYTIEEDNRLSRPTVICRFSHGVFPDGLTMDNRGHLWVTSIVSNRIIRINPNNGNQSVILEDNDKHHVDWVEQAYQTHNMGREHLDSVSNGQLKNISSLAFGGADLCTAYIGCLLGNQLAVFRSEFAGIAPAHWAFDD